jgi:hypothetical protein
VLILKRAFPGLPSRFQNFKTYCSKSLKACRSVYATIRTICSGIYRARCSALTATDKLFPLWREQMQILGWVDRSSFLCQRCGVIPVATLQKTTGEAASSAGLGVSAVTIAPLKC